MAQLRKQFCKLFNFFLRTVAPPGDSSGPFQLVSVLTLSVLTFWDFPGGSTVKNLPASAGDVGDSGSILGSGRSPEKEMVTFSNILNLENSMDRGAWWAAVHGVLKSQT